MANLTETGKPPSWSASMIRPLIEACRPYQWVKNVLVFVPVFAAHDLASAHFAAALAAFLCFSAAASAGYLVNDIRDIDADRSHPRKRARPFASGRVSAASGVALAAVLFALALLGAAWVRVELLWALLCYVVVTFGYTTLFKRFSLIDVLVLAGLYTLRIIAGGAATGIPLTMWLLGFSMFLFTSLAFAKRYSETIEMEGRNEAMVAGRGYRAGDSVVLLALGTASGVAAVLTLALYINSTASAGLYSRPEMLWGVCPLLLYWIGRVWLAAQRKMLDDDPIVFAFRDRISLVIFAVTLVPLALAL
jgi:4-hydroxybenzoate polyprenyltransferase